jgi:ribosomal protein S12 methylthiotransferase accessory factor YcaO
MESSGFSLGLPAEPEPRNIVPATSSTANQPGVTTSNAAYASAVNAASSALTAEAIRSSASPASLSQKETSASATEQESGWHWADRAQICEACVFVKRILR